MYTTHTLYGLGTVQTAGSFAPGTLPMLRKGISIDQRKLTRSTNERAIQQIQEASRPIAALSTAAREAIQNTDALRRREPPPIDPPKGSKCGCYVDAVEAHASKQGLTVDAATKAQLTMQCVADEAGFLAAMKEGKVAHEACKPLYMRKSTWILGGIALVGAMLVLR